MRKGTLTLAITSDALIIKARHGLMCRGDCGRSARHHKLQRPDLGYRTHTILLLKKLQNIQENLNHVYFSYVCSQLFHFGDFQNTTIK